VKEDWNNILYSRVCIMTTRRWFLLTLSLALTPLASCYPWSRSTTIQGCGATFPAPLYQRWFLEFYQANPTIRVNYQAIGSGAGVSQFRDGLVDFAGTDEALKEKELADIEKKLGVGVFQMPLTAGAVAICYNLPGNPDLRLTRQALVSIFLGEIDSWDHSEIRACNPDVELPALPIRVVRRAEGSGTTAVFTNHLNAIDSRWTAKWVGKSIEWPVGIGGKGNAGVNALIKQTPGAIGYIEAGYAALTGLKPIALQNRAGQFVLPTEENTRLALGEVRLNKVLEGAVKDPRGKTAYPIATFTWVVCREQYAKPAVAKAIRDVMTYCLHDEPGVGQGISLDLHYVPLPAEVAEKSRQALARLQIEDPADSGSER
jgi:phosphate transport system substrate-binding protein